MAVVWVFSLILFVLGAPGQADAAWVRDEIRVNMRSGPGTQYRIVKLLRSGDEIQDLGTQGDWTRIRSNDGEEGWVPKGYMVEEPPASVTVPQLRTRLQLAEASVGD
ncbi:MAG: TIGR04211 family SH3 domain-containing protein, partial [Myxococcota bacterium]